ncbi:MAG: hypothetical protein ACFWT6_16135 [Virgibacillus proomii]
MNKKFQVFSFTPIINQVIDRLGFSTPTEIQQQVIPAILAGKV